MPPKKKKRIKKAIRQKKRLTPIQAMMAQLIDLCPPIKETTGDMRESWILFAQKLLLAKRLKTTVNVVTVNPQMIEYRALLQKKFKCDIMSPTEARFGLDSIEMYKG